MEHKKVLERDRTELERLLVSDNPEEIVEGLYSACRFEDDWRWLQELCLDLIGHPVTRVGWAAVTCLGDLAWFRRFPIDVSEVTSALELAIKDEAIRDPASYSLKLVKEFAG